MSQHRRRQYAYRTRGTCDKCTSTLLACRKAAKIPCSSSPWLRGHASFRNGASVTHVGDNASRGCQVDAQTAAAVAHLKSV